MSNNAVKILRIDTSARTRNSHSRLLTEKLTDKLINLYPDAVITERNLYGDLTFLSETMVEAMFIEPASRTHNQNNALSFSDALVNELKDADILVFGIPMYNFGIPATLKAYIDLVTRSGLTFKYSDTGVKGLVENVKAYIVVTSGGTPLYSDIDFVSGYMKLILGFIGINDVQFIDATEIARTGVNEIMTKASTAIDMIS